MIERHHIENVQKMPEITIEEAARAVPPGDLEPEDIVYFLYESNPYVHVRYSGETYEVVRNGERFVDPFDGTDYVCVGNSVVDERDRAMYEYLAASSIADIGWMRAAAKKWELDAQQRGQLRTRALIKLFGEMGERAVVRLPAMSAG